MEHLAEFPKYKSDGYQKVLVTATNFTSDVWHWMSHLTEPDPTQPNPTHFKYKILDPTQPNPTQPMG